MTDSTPAQLAAKIIQQYTNFLNNIANQKHKFIMYNSRPISIDLLYNSSGDSWFIAVRDVMTGLAVSDNYTSYAGALAVYDALS